jgi:hypothetical protein
VYACSSSFRISSDFPIDPFLGDEPCPVAYPDDVLKVHVDRLGQGRLQITTNLLLVMSTQAKLSVSTFRPTRPDPTSTEPVYAIIG